MNRLDIDFHALPFPPRGMLDTLRAAGVSNATLADPRCFVKAAPVVPLAPDRFDFAADGREVAIIACHDAFEEVTDVVAFVTTDPSRVRRYAGRAVFLGEHVLANPATCALGEPLRLYRTPLSWLVAGGHGAVVLDPAQAWRALLDVPAIAGEDKEHARALADIRSPPLCRVMIPAEAA